MNISVKLITIIREAYQYELQMSNVGNCKRKKAQGFALNLLLFSNPYLKMYLSLTYTETF
jgi:hypothetical protein